MTKIFIVDDAAAYRDSLHRLLSLCGFEVAAAGSGPRTDALIADFHPHVLLLDWRLDEHGDGLPWIERLRQSGADFPLIVASGCPCSRREARLAALPQVFCLAKPYSSEALLATIEAATGCALREPAMRSAAEKQGESGSRKKRPRRALKTPVRD